MKVSYNWLKEFVDFNITPEELAHKLTMAGLEVEEIDTLENDTVIDIGVTPNRPDCLSMRGIAREISAILDTPLKDISVIIDNETGEGPLVDIEVPELCPRYSSRTISGVKPGPSPEWLVKRLESCGVRSTSNIVDVTNYVMLEMGQPMHAFDLDQLAGGKIVVKQAGEAMSFVTLDNIERKISGDTLLIWDAEKPVAIAGVMGGLNSEVSDDSVNILLESACFHPSSVRRTSRTLNLSSEASYRFERGIDREAVTLAMDRAAELIAEIAGGRISKITDNYPLPYKAKDITVSLNRINSVIGVTIEKPVVVKILSSLGCTVESTGESIKVTPPSYREDIEKEIDIVEEVARLYGFDNIPSTFPVIQMSAAPVHKRQDLVHTIKECMVKSGFSEVINFSFLNPDSLDKLNISENDRRRSLIYIKNPLKKEDSAMRTTLIPGLLNNIITNLNRGEKMLRFFEVSRVFYKTDNKLPDEVVQLGAVYHKDHATALWGTTHNGFYDVKGVFENIFSFLKISDVSFVKEPEDAEPYLHPAKSCSLYMGKKKIGTIGILHPAAAESFDIKGELITAEIYNIDDLLVTPSTETSFVPLPKFPYIERDIAILLNDDVTVDAVKKEINGIDSDIIEAVRLFDIYKGKSISGDKKSLAFSIRYRSTERTLTDSEVDELHSRITKLLQDSLKAELRS